MLFQFKQFLSPPVFPDDPNKTAVARVIHVITVFLSVVAIVAIPFFIITSGDITSSLLRNIGPIIGMLGIKYLNKKGYTSLSSWLIVGVVWLIGFLIFIPSGGVQAPGYVVWLNAVLIAGILLGWRVALVVTLANGIFGLLLLWLANQGLLLDSPLPGNDFRVWFFHILVALTQVVLLWVGLGSIRGALARAQEELHQRKLSEERFTKIFKSSPNALIISELESGIILDVNDSFEKLSGFQKEEIIGTTAVALGVYEDEYERSIWLNEAKESDFIHNLEISLHNKDDQLRTILSSIKTIELDNKSCAIIYVQDITERKQAENILLESETRFRSIFEDAGIGMVLVGLNHNIVKANRAFTDMLGYLEDELIGTLFKDITYPDDVRISIESHERLIRGELPVYQFEKRYLHKQGHIVWALLNVSSVHSVAEQPAYAIVQVQDITDRKQAEADREILIQELERRNAELERFAYTVSHDLKSPLVTIGGFLGFLERDAENGNVEQFRSDINSIRRAADKMRRLLDDLLELSRIGRLMNLPEEVSFAEIVADALAVTQGQLMECEVELVSADEFPHVIGDRVRLVEVVQNLVDNAAKFSKDQPQPCIRIGVRHVADGSIFYVQDNGIGIPSRHHDKIFDIFNKLNPEVEGTGIGLALVKRIIEVHNGRLWVESGGLGQGSTFYFTLNENMKTG